MAEHRQLTTADLEGIVAWSLVRAARQAVRGLTDVLLPSELTPVQFGVLAQLSVDGSLTQAALAREILVRPQSMSVLLAGMESRGLIARTGDRGRGRRNPVELTAAGRELLSSVWADVISTNDLSRAGIGTAEAASLNAGLLRLLRPGADHPDWVG